MLCVLLYDDMFGIYIDLVILDPNIGFDDYNKIL